MKNFISKYKTHISLIVVLILAASLRLYRIEFLDIWRDEAFSIKLAEYSFLDVIKLAVKDTQPPLHLLSLHFWMMLFGNSSYSVRILSLIFGVLTVILTFLVSLEIIKNKKIAVSAALFTAVNPVLILLSQEARGYTMMSTFTLGAVLFGYRSYKERSIKNYFGFILFITLGLYTHNLVLVVLTTLVLLFIGSLFIKERYNIRKMVLSNDFKTFIFIFVIITILYIPWLFAFAEQYSKVSANDFWLEFEPLKNIRDTAMWMFFSEKVYPSTLGANTFLQASVFIIGILFSIIGGFKEIKSSKKELPFLSVFIGLVYTLIFIISIKTPFFYIRYLSFSIPFILILLAKGIISLNHKISTLLIILFVICSIVLYKNYISTNEFKAPYTKAIYQLDYNSQTDIIIHPHAITYHPFNYYFDLPNFIYDPVKNIDYYEGVSYLEEKDYYVGTLLEYKRLWVLWEEKDDFSYIYEKDFYKTETHEYAGGLHLDLWVRRETIDIALNY